MVFLLIHIFFLFYTCAYVQANCNNIEGYFWLDFTGEIPRYALPAGRDVNGKPIYFGQVVNAVGHTVRLVPCKIYINERRVYYELHAEEWNATENIKIFCTQHPEQFEWIKTNNKDINWLTDKHLIIGGWEPYTTTYIGRARQGAEVLVGKIITNHAEQYVGLHVTSRGTPTRHTSYEILSYNSKHSPTSVCSDLDAYFWVDFTGEIPPYALPGGKDISGKPVYIGQVVGLETIRHLIPAAIYLNDQRAYTQLNGQGLNITDNIKIFCTEHPEHFEWVKTDIDAIKLLTDKQLVIGGWEPKYTTYIGRVRYRGRVCVGKVTADTDEVDHAGLHINYEGKGIRFASFEVLAYNPNLGANPVCKDIEGYYWRNFKGIVPRDAVEGAYDTNTDIMSYIGQTLHGGVVIPGSINGYTKKMTYEWDSQIYEGHNSIKILCSAHTEHFGWTSSKNLNFKNLADNNLVSGGDESGNEFYIGRVYINGEYIIGRANLQSSDSNIVLFAPGKDGTVMQHSIFEVLIFNEDIQSSQTLKPNRTMNPNMVVTKQGSQNCKQISINLYT